ncbi:hypothetical protein [Microbacterium laevaniformans]|uniref:hypothetical protein n=1 Tax=Microbacterium laevaniformans TaxID=36807 RepID=UPI0036729DD9
MTLVNTTEVSVRDGVRSLMEVYAHIQHNDWVVIAYTPDSRMQAAHVVAYVNAHGISHSTVAMLPLVDELLNARLTQALPKPSAFEGNLVVITLERDTMSHFDQFAPLFRVYGAGRTKVIRIISASDEFFRQGLLLTPQELEDLNATVLDFLAEETNIVVTSPSGTYLEIELDQRRFQWISNRGKLRPGAFTILPAGEIATHPERVDGKLVADGAINCNVISRLDMRLREAPLVVDVSDSYVTNFQCANPELFELVSTGFGMTNARRVGELGFGTNRALGDFLSHNSHLNERHPGVHIGFGQHNQSLDVLPYEADIHLDAVTNGATIYGARSGRVLDLASFQPDPAIAHPTLMRDEDITGDCCSAGCAVIAV